MHYILQLDQKQYVYLRDIFHDHLLFAMSREEHEHFSDLLSRYDSDAACVPDDYKLEVVGMTEVSEDVYVLNNERILHYPVNNLSYALVQAYEPKGGLQQTA